MIADSSSCIIRLNRFDDMTIIMTWFVTWIDRTPCDWHDGCVIGMMFVWWMRWSHDWHGYRVIATTIVWLSHNVNWYDSRVIDMMFVWSYDWYGYRVIDMMIVWLIWWSCDWHADCNWYDDRVIDTIIVWLIWTLHSCRSGAPEASSATCRGWG